MEQLYACGFDGLGQLTGHKNTRSSTPSFELIARGNSLRVLFSSFGRTIYADERHMYTIGIPNSYLIPVPASRIRCVFGTDEEGAIGLVTSNRRLYSSLPGKHRKQTAVLEQSKLRTRGGSKPSDRNEITSLAVAGSGKAAATFLRQNGDIISTLIVTSSALQDLIVSSDAVYQESKNLSRLVRPGQARQLVANALAFTLLMQDGTVYTWGDPRYGSLGRQQEDGFDIPSRVAALQGSKVKKIAAGGFFTAALIEDGRLFVWGVARPGGPQVTILTGDEPTIFEHITVTREDTVADVAIGDSHIVVLTSDGRVFGVGEGVDGQLGSMSEKLKGFAASWRQISTEKVPTIKSIACGRQSTFLICQGSGDSFQTVHNGDAIQVLTPSDDEPESAVSENSAGEESSDGNESEQNSDDSNLPMEGPDDWFRGGAE
ncbi:RCC1/BLIP-II [Viridothelium virens]|uniref:RCC1/BLIP-II n=1 Tax=Viridothelium virens TaxID=1048519 RepID=A0A6A6HFR8_VIRVR|nr:RCC1/BLIP-II [Viridothelium virens]